MSAAAFRWSVGCRACRQHWEASEPAPFDARCPSCDALDVHNWGRIITSVDDVTPDVLDAAIGAADHFPPPTPIDWENLIDRLERDGPDGWTFGVTYDTPAIAKIKRVVRQARRDAS